MFCCFCRQTSGIAIELLALANLLFLLSGLQTATQVLWKEMATWGNKLFFNAKAIGDAGGNRFFSRNSHISDLLCKFFSQEGSLCGTWSPAEPQVTLRGQKYSSLQTCSLQYSQCYLFSKEVSKILFHLIVELCVYPLPHLKPVLVTVTNMMQYSRK